MPRTKGSKNRVTVSTDFDKRINCKIAKELENNAKTWYNFDTNKPVLVRQRYAVVL